MENSSITGTKKPEDSLICQIDKYFSELIPSQNLVTKKNKITEHFYSNLSSVSAVPREILNLPAFKTYHSAHLLIQEKGKISTDHFYISRSQSTNKEFLPSTTFNKVFALIRKSKNKIFNQSQLGEVHLNLVGTFLAHTYSLKKHNLIIIISRNDFLSPSHQELLSYEIFCEKLDPSLELLVEKEFNLNEIALIKLMLSEFPFPLTILDDANKEILKSTDNQPKHIQKIITLKNKSKLITYDFNQNENTSSELFHFERITLLGELLNTLRHELNNPLFGLKLTTDLIISETTDSEQSYTLKEIKNNITRCQDIIENFTNLYQNSNILIMSELKKLIDESMTLAKSEIRQIKINVNFINIDANTIIYTNPISVVQIFFNLIVNSSQAIRQAQTSNPNININIRKIDEFFLIELIDNRPGIKPEIYEKLFDPFFTTKTYGTGLGLPITAGLVNQLGGSITIIKSNSGAHFNIKLPVHKELAPL